MVVFILEKKISYVYLLCWLQGDCRVQFFGNLKNKWKEILLWELERREEVGEFDVFFSCYVSLSEIQGK